LPMLLPRRIALAEKRLHSGVVRYKQIDGVHHFIFAHIERTEYRF
jgi:hypothetical protein